MVFDMPECGGCRSCELVCSFHHVGVFQSSVSSLRIIDKDDGAGFRVSLLEEASGLAKACDDCEGLEVPMCVEYCRESQVLKEILQGFRSKVRSGRRAVQQEVPRKGVSNGREQRNVRVGRQDPAG